MSTTNDCNKSSVKQSFKAVENFLRRIAFNLGNSPSRTDVKIVSCIPIDVTDLQQRIIQLQDELAGAKEAKHQPEKPTNNVCTPCPNHDDINNNRQLCCNQSEKPTNNVYTACTNNDDNNNNIQLYCNDRLLTATSVLSVSCPTVYPSLDQEISSAVSPSSITYQVTATGNTEELRKHKQFLSKKKKESKTKYPKTHLVYRAHADTNTPFRNNNSLGEYYETRQDNETVALNRSYLAEVIQRQYRPNDRPFLNESNVSDISYPVCRDDPPLYWQGAPYPESDRCSCCHGQYQNVDKYMNNKPHIHSPYENVENARKYYKSSYYDSNFYDLVPVKEKVAKKNNIVLQKGNASKKPTIKCWPGKERAKTTVVNFCALSPVAETKYSNRKSLARSQKYKDVVTNHMASKRVETSTPRRAKERDDYSHAFTKQDRKNIKQISVPITTQVQDAATDSIVSATMAVCQTATTLTDKDPPEDKTEITLNEIKDILQSVLTEVKTNSMLANLPAQPKKDAIVQNGPLTASRACEYGASQLLHTYTYSPHNIINPYNMNMNPYKASCSHTIPSNNFVYPGEYPGVPGMPGVPTVPIQQFPLLIQPQKLMCSNYYRNNSISKPVTKYAATAATNTEQPQEHSKETERLIKEIYKSIALNIEESSKDNSVLEYMKTKDITDKYINSVKVESDTETERISKAISEIFKNTHLPDSTVTATTTSTYTDYQESNKIGTEYKGPAKREYRSQRAYSQRENDNYANDNKQKSYHHHHHHHHTVDRSDTTVINEVTEEEVSSESDTLTDKVAVKKETLKAMETKKPTETPKALEMKKVKGGLLKKMFKSFFQPKTKTRYRREGGEVENQKESESDSDDYQTVYSQKVTTLKPKKVTTVRSRPHSKVFNAKKPQQKPRTKSPEKHTRSPSYTEQEYKRYLEEKRESYEKQRKKYSTDVARGTGDNNRKVQVYHQQYEARPVIVDTVRQPPLRPPGFGVRPRYSPYKAQHTRRTDNSPTAASANKPHYVASKNKSKGFFSGDWLKKTKIQCGECKNEWKELIFNG